MPEIDPNRINTLQELVDQLVLLFHQKGCSIHRLAEAADLSSSTVQAILTKTTAVPRAGTVEAFVTACGQPSRPWLEARGRAVQNAQPKQPSRAQLQAELEELRQKKGAQEIEVDLRVRAGAPVRPVDSRPQAVQQWLEEEKRVVMASLLRWEREQRRQAEPNAYLAGQALAQSLEQAMRGLRDSVKHTPEDRTPQEYRAEVAAYLQRCADSWTDALVPGAAAHVAPLELELSNLLLANLAEVEVQLYVPGNVVAVQPRFAAVAANESFVVLPDRPRAYGPRQAPIFDPLPGYRIPIGARLVGPRARPPVPRIDNGGSTTITFSPVHLRPHPYGRVQLDPIVLVVEAPAPAVITAEWWATSTSMDGAMHGQLPISIAETPLPLATVLTEPDTWQHGRSARG